MARPKEVDNKDRIRMCLNCPYDADACLGEANCKARGRDEFAQKIKADKDIVRYATAKGWKPVQIANMIGRSVNGVKALMEG